MHIVFTAVLMLTVCACNKAHGPTTADGLPVSHGANTTGDGIPVN